jgi:hypothetical protein
MKGAALLAVAAIGFAHAAHAQSPRQALFDDDVLMHSIREIGVMSRDELGPFADTLAACGAAAQSKEQRTRDRCATVLARYRMEWDSRRAVDLLLLALDHTATYTRMMDGIAAANSKERTELLELVKRSANIRGDLADAATERFAEIRQAPR